MPSAIEQAIRQICDEKGLAYESVIEAIQAALAAAYRKDFGNKLQNIETEFNPEDGSVRVFDVKTVVEDMDLEELERLEEERKAKAEALAKQIEEAREKGEELPAVSFEEDEGPRFNPKTDIMLSEARKIKPDAKVGDIIRTELDQPQEFGRMAAMTAKQVIMQKLREAEREVVFSEFKEYEGTIINGTVQRREGRIVLVDLGRTTGILRPEDQIPTERYNPGDRIKVYVRSVTLTTRGPEILLSRASEEFVRKLFEFEIPEVAEGLVEIKSIAREAGSRSKVAVWTEDDQIDPIGACIGQRGTRIQTIIAELGGEKVDIIEWSEDPTTFITNALSPAKIDRVELNEEEKSAVVFVESDQLSLAIGKGGQNVRLAAHLTGWKINISEIGAEPGEEQDEAGVSEDGQEEGSEAREAEQPEEVEQEQASAPAEESEVNEGAEDADESEASEEDDQTPIQEDQEQASDQKGTDEEIAEEKPSDEESGEERE
ncbi:transcription termination/antitermination protein NusA [Candidatus Woesearchaeota archaeon]|nr:MAG: transcription termination/antitermination protein NusA [Candidatus Woesearchaeota archaeon]